MKKLLLKRIILWDETHPLNGSATDILVEDGMIIEIVLSGEKQWDKAIPIVLENAHISGGWHDKALFVTNQNLSSLFQYSRETGFKKVSLIHFPHLIAEVYYQDIADPIVEHFIPLFSNDGQPVDIKGLNESSGWVIFLDDPIDSLSNILEELQIIGKPLIIMPFERQNPDPYSVTYSTDNLWKGINAIRPELLKAKLSALTQLLSHLNTNILSPFLIPQASNLIPLLSLIPSQDPDGFPTKQLPSHNPKLVKQLKDLGSNQEHIVGVASCNWLNAQQQNVPWDIRHAQIFDLQRTKKAISMLLKATSVQDTISMLTSQCISNTINENTIFSFDENDITFHNI